MTDSALPTFIAESRELLREMEAALLECEQGESGYQPKADIRTGIVRGVEALARWTHPTLGPIPPDLFIPLAERSQLIHRLTIDVMNQAMLQNAAWRARGLHLPVAVNLSPTLLERADLALEISSLQQCHGLTPDGEITRHSRRHPSLNVLAQLRLRDFGLSIDDYGTGFSSMQQLARIPFTELKIDRSFVRGGIRLHARPGLAHRAACPATI